MFNIVTPYEIDKDFNHERVRRAIVLINETMRHKRPRDAITVRPIQNPNLTRYEIPFKSWILTQVEFNHIRAMLKLVGWDGCFEIYVNEQDNLKGIKGIVICKKYP